MKKLSVRLIGLAVIAAVLLAAMPTALAQDGIETVCLVTDVGRVNDGTFNQYAYEGMEWAAEDFDLESTHIETTASTDYEANINTCIADGAEAVITVGFMLGDATAAAAEANPDVFFLGVDQGREEYPDNYVGILFREDQAGFLAGVLAALVADSMEADTVAGVYGMEIPPVVKFRNGFEQGARYINEDINTLGVYIENFVAPDLGASAAEQFMGEGAVVIFGAGGQTGSGGIVAAAQAEVYVIGVDQDEYFTTFDSGETPGAEFLISSAVKRVDQGVYDMLGALADPELADMWMGGGVYLMEAANDGVGFAEKHDADIDDEIYEQVQEVLDLMAEGEIETGVDPITGELLEEE